MVALGVTTVAPEVPEALKPVPVQEVAKLDFQERVDDCPALTDVGSAESWTVGAGHWSPDECAYIRKTSIIPGVHPLAAEVLPMKVIASYISSGDLYAASTPGTAGWVYRVQPAPK